jgi:alkylation response protein AidB-like acyl-CoA dehydrogenase
MMIERSELHDAAKQAFGNEAILMPREQAWPMVAELGWLLLPVPEDMGGLGLGLDSSAAIHYELGRVLGTAPLVPALMVIRALVEAGKADLVERAAGGELMTTALVLKGVSEADGKLSGTLEGVVDADIASHVLVITEGLGLCALVPTDAAGVTLTPRHAWDESRKLFDVALDGVAVDPSLVLARGEAVLPISKAVKAEMLAGIAADSLGAAAAVLEMSVEYLKTRRQFDRPLAMFQALKHRVADLKAQLDATTALLWSRTSQPEPRTAELGGLKAIATDVCRMVAEEAVQFHGGIGLTEEYPVHHYLKRALMNLQLGGSLDLWREAAGRAALKEHLAVA